MRHSGAVITRPPASSIPDTPGSYQFIDAGGRVLYVGKAKSLRSRLSNYFADPATLPPRTAQMVAAADHVEWIQVSNDVEAVMLEYSLIKQHRPRFNIRLVDDKSYPWLAITLGDEWPRAAVVRGKRRPGNRYFGPYAHAGAIRGTLDLLLRSFGVRTCSDTKLGRHVRLGRPCLLYHIEKCSGPCIGAVDHETYSALLADLMAFLSGDTDPVVRRIETEMRQAATDLDFERAARLRDRLGAVRLAIERQQVVSMTPENLDVIGLADDELEAAVCVFHVRRGRVVGRRAFIVDKVEDLSKPRLIGRVLEQVYGDSVPALESPAELSRRTGRKARRNDPSDHEGWASGASDPRQWGLEGSQEPGVPRRVLVPELPEDPPVYEAFLSTLRGGPVALAVPMRGGRRALIETVARNASEELTRHRLRRAQDHNSRARALEALQQALGLELAPLRIECFDMSHLQGTDYVGSMVVLEDGLPRPSEYRRFKVRDVAGNDDYAAMHEVLTRRFTALLQARERAAQDTSADSKTPRQVRVPAPTPAFGRRERPARCRGARAREPGSFRRDPRRGIGEELRGGVQAGESRPGEDSSRVRRTVPAAKSPRRGTPFRHQLSPAAAWQAHDPQRPRRSVRARSGPQGAPDPRAREHRRGEEGIARGASRAPVATRRDRARALTASSTTPSRRGRPGHLFRCRWRSRRELPAPGGDVGVDDGREGSSVGGPVNREAAR